jgi:hypothetical protein
MKPPSPHQATTDDTAPIRPTLEQDLRELTMARAWAEDAYERLASGGNFREDSINRSMARTAAILFMKDLDALIDEADPCPPQTQPSGSEPSESRNGSYSTTSARAAS